MHKKKVQYTGRFPENLNNDIYLNIENLKEGSYTLRLIDDNKIVKKVQFKKKKSKNK